MRKTARKAYMKRRNPARKRKSSRRVVRRLIRNPERSMEIKALSPVKKSCRWNTFVRKEDRPIRRLLFDRYGCDRTLQHGI